MFHYLWFEFKKLHKFPPILWVLLGIITVSSNFSSSKELLEEFKFDDYIFYKIIVSPRSSFSSAVLDFCKCSL